MQRKIIPNHILLPEVVRLVDAGQHVRIRVKGSSMIPFLYGDRDEVILSPCRKDTLEAGQIVLALIPATGKYVLHRILAKRNRQIILMGDGNLSGTEVCGEADIRAVVNQAIRNGRKVDLSSGYWQFLASCWRRAIPVRRYLLFVCKGVENPEYFLKRLKCKLNI